MDIEAAVKMQRETINLVMQHLLTLQKSIDDFNVHLTNVEDDVSKFAVTVNRIKKTVDTLIVKPNAAGEDNK